MAGGGGEDCGVCDACLRVLRDRSIQEQQVNHPIKTLLGCCAPASYAYGRETWWKAAVDVLREGAAPAAPTAATTYELSAEPIGDTMLKVDRVEGGGGEVRPLLS